MEKKLSFAIENVDISDERNDSQFALVKIDAFASGNNRHNMPVSEETLRRTSNSIYHKPLIWNYSRYFDDADTHGDLNVPCGFVHNNVVEFRVLEDGRIMMSVEALIWKYYCGQLMEIYSRDNAKKSVSVEIEVFDVDEATMEIKDFRYTAITILGDHVSPAIPGAKSEVIKFAKEYRTAMENEFSNIYEDVDFSIPENVKMNSNKGLENYKKYGRGGNSVALAMARFMVKHKEITPDRIRSIVRYFERSKFNSLKEIEPPSNELITWMLWGGKDAFVWSKSIVSQMETINNQKMSYFGDENIVYLDDGEKGQKESEGSTMEEEKDMQMAEQPVEKDESEAKTEQFEQEPVAQEPEEKESEETESEESEESEEEESGEKENMSSNEYADVSAMLAMLGGETEDQEALAAQYRNSDGGVDFCKLAYAIFEKAQKFSEQLSVFAEENDSLRAFKSDIEQQQFSYIVDSTLKEVELDMSSDDLDAARRDSVNFSLSNINIWANSIKAKAFECSKHKKNGKDDEVVRIGLPFAAKPKKTNSLWE